jgi:hypothetical protein
MAWQQLAVSYGLPIAKQIGQAAGEMALNAAAEKGLEWLYSNKPNNLNQYSAHSSQDKGFRNMVGSPINTEAMYAPGSNGNFSTLQATAARNENAGFAGNKTREQIAYEAQMKRQEADYLESLARGRADFTADLGNRAANSNTARSMAFDTTQNLNRMYATTGDRLNQAAANTQNALNQAAATVAGMFR